MRSHRDAVDKLHGAPEAVELHALIHVHDAIGGGRPAPDRVLQEAADACQDDLKHGQPAAQALLGKQVTLTSNGNLLVRRHMHQEKKTKKNRDLGQQKPQ